MDEDKRRGFEPEKIEIETSEEGEGGAKKHTKVSIGTEDVIALFAGIVAVIIALGMVFGVIPVNELTIGVLTFSGAGAAIAKIISARKKKQKQD